MKTGRHQQIHVLMDLVCKKIPVLPDQQMDYHMPVLFRKYSLSLQGISHSHNDPLDLLTENAIRIQLVPVNLRLNWGWIFGHTNTKTTEWVQIPDNSGSFFQQRPILLSGIRIPRQNQKEESRPCYMSHNSCGIKSLTRYYASNQDNSENINWGSNFKLTSMIYLNILNI